METTVTQRLPILYALQFHPESKPQAMALARLMADIEPVPQTKMGFMFCPRYDTLVDTQTEVIVREKFPDTKICPCRNRFTGWPKGPNAMAHEVYSEFSRQCLASANDKWQYAAIFMGEPDCVPLSVNWIEDVWNEWHTCDWSWPLGNNQLTMGHWLTTDSSDCGIPHMNGNMLISPHFLSAYPAFRVTNFGAWDTTHSRSILNHGRPSKVIFSDYGIGGKDPRNPWKGCDDLFKTRHMGPANPLHGIDLHPSYLHGVKDMRALDCIRERLVTQNQNDNTIRQTDPSNSNSNRFIQSTAQQGRRTATGPGL